MIKNANHPQNIVLIAIYTKELHVISKMIQLHLNNFSKYLSFSVLTLICILREFKYVYSHYYLADIISTIQFFQVLF